jgi:hypothetical protein
MEDLGKSRRDLLTVKLITEAWFSAGALSAVATKLIIEQIHRIIYTHIDDQHPDTFDDCGLCCEMLAL